jgi:hypothetical protein|nr:MAG TPA: hypothetical protein [Caudoviricetes sp.]
MSDNSLSPVFNVRGIENLNTETKYSNIPMWRDVGGTKARNYIVSEEETYKIITEDISYGSSVSSLSEEDQSGADLENSKGVISINMPAIDQQ